MGTFGSTFGRNYNFSNIVVTPPPTGSAPEITGETESFLSINRVGVSCSINPNGEATSIILQYGLTTSYGSTVIMDNLVGTSPIPISAIIPKSTPDIYHYRIVATNAEGTTNGTDQTFTIYPGVGRDLTDYSTALNAVIATFTGSSYYIDPDAATNGTGTELSPYNTWSGLALTADNKYYQKRGTTAILSGAGLASINGRCLIGAYGSGNERATIQQSSAGNCIATSYQIVVMDIDITGATPASPGLESGSGIRMLNTSYGQVLNNWVYNCEIHNFGDGITCSVNPESNYWSGIKILYSHIHHCAIEGIMFNDVTDIEVAHCYIHHINRYYFINTDQDYSNGDCIQAQFADGLNPASRLVAYFHHNTFDRTLEATFNKFCIIANDQDNNEETYIYNNHFICPLRGTGPDTSALYLSTSSAVQGHTNKSYVYNNIFEGGNFGIVNYLEGGCNVYYNLFIDQYVCIATYSSGSDTNIYNNIFKNYIGAVVPASTPSVVRSNNNVFIKASGTNPYSGTSGLVSNTHNHFVYGTPSGTNYTTGDAGFVDEANMDFRILTTSVLKNSGTNVSLTEDFFGTSLPQGASVDKGIHEFV